MVPITGTIQSNNTVMEVKKDRNVKALNIVYAQVSVQS